MTNFEKIKETIANMSIEDFEKASATSEEFLVCSFIPISYCESGTKSCTQCKHDWLREEVTDNANL